MIQNFIRETKELTKYEAEVLLPIISMCLQHHVGKDKAVTNRHICERMKKRGYELTETRVRKIVNSIRTNNLVECLIATSRGYYVTHDQKELENYIKSLKGREEAIRLVREALEQQSRKILLN